jgi:MoxR-like ATPase
MREWSRSETTLNTAQKAGGLGGLIIEGPPGIGKSELVISALITRGYQQEHDFSRPSQKQNLFYRMPITMGLNEKRAFLLKAFHEGAVVVIDEMNSSPMMERLLNDLLMGKTPEGQAEAPVKPGFMIIATQNPVTMAGRRAVSTAIRRRCITHDLPEYKPEEIQHTLVSKGIPPNEAQAMTEAFEKNRIYAIKNQLSPVPNFRHLVELAHNQLKATEDSILSFQGLVQHSIFQANSRSTLQPPQNQRHP